MGVEGRGIAAGNLGKEPGLHSLAAEIMSPPLKAQGDPSDSKAANGSQGRFLLYS